MISDLPFGSPDLGLVVKSPGKRHAIIAPFNTTLDCSDKDLVVQYEVRFQEGLSCGGAYIKLLTASSQHPLYQNEEPDGYQVHREGDNHPQRDKYLSFYDKNSYTIMFGPDKCGHQDKLHFIIRQTDQGRVTEKHLKEVIHVPVDRRTHLYTLVIRKNHSFQIFVDLTSVSEGSILDSEAFKLLDSTEQAQPPFPKEQEQETEPEPETRTKTPTQSSPSEKDIGSCEQPKPFVLDKMSALAIEILTATKGIYFDNFLITHDENIYKTFAMDTWHKKYQRETKIQKKYYPQTPEEVELTWDEILFLFTYGLVEWVASFDLLSVVWLVCTILYLMAAFYYLCQRCCRCCCCRCCHCCCFGRNERVSQPSQ
eukprot:TRINITY_DN109_c0_g3_i1.p1 TRINITY_DN109_c0_g3~~TRINITY_DN109_c0_g3_i1.p1  ORF type:complete len:368 (+),score=71.18 TRINITY_DN109_c0_g3_i1:261-1364(+)